MNAPLSHSRISKLVTRLALVLALVVGLAPVAGYWSFSYVKISSQVESDLRVQARALDDFIAAQPETWDVSTDRLLGEMDRFLSYDKGFRIFDIKGEVVAEAPPRIKGPFITRVKTVYDFGRPVGRIEGKESCRNELLTGLGILSVSLVAAWLLWVPIRVLPLAALAASERKLRTRERYQRALLDNFPFMVWLKDVEERYLAVNAKFLEFVSSASEEQIIGKTDREIGAVRLKELLAGGEAPGRDGGAPLRVERTLDINGEKRCFAVYSNPLSLDGAFAGTVAYAQDITERKQLEEMMIQSEKMMSVGGLAAGMAHEINNPLGGILQNVQVMQRRLTLDIPANVQAAEDSGCSFDAVRLFMEKRGIVGFMEAIHDAGTRAARIVASMLEFSRKSSSAPIPTDVNALLDRAVELCSSDYNLLKKCDFRNIRINRDYAPDLPLLPCSSTQIEQVVVNVLRNASQAMDQAPANGRSPRITLRTRLDGGHIRIEVQDNGPGMAEAVRHKVFEPFFTTKPVGEGTGLGLSVSYFIVVNNHGGTFEAQSSPGEGTRIIIRLPLDRKSG